MRPFTCFYGLAAPAPLATCDKNPDPRKVAAGHCHVVLCKNEEVRHVRFAMDDLDPSKRAVDLMVIEDAVKTTAWLKYLVCFRRYSCLA